MWPQRLLATSIGHKRWTDRGRSGVEIAVCEEVPGRLEEISPPACNPGLDSTDLAIIHWALPALFSVPLFDYQESRP